MQVTRHHSCRVSPFGHPRIHARLTAPRGITQPPTSFIGSQCQGIHHAPLNTYNTKQLKNSRKNQKIALPQHTTTPTPKRTEPLLHQMLATTIHKSNTTPHHQSMEQQPTPTSHPNHEGTPPPVSHNRDEEIAGLLPQSPIVCLAIPSPAFDHSKPVPAQRLLCTRPTTHYRRRAIHTNRPSRTDPRTMRAGLRSRGAP